MFEYAATDEPDKNRVDPPPAVNIFSAHVPEYLWEPIKAAIMKKPLPKSNAEEKRLKESLLRF